MKKGKLTNVEKETILKKMSNKTFSTKKVAKELDRSEGMVQNFVDSVVVTQEQAQLPMKQVTPVTTPVEHDSEKEIKKLQDRILELEREKVGPQNKWKGKVRIMTEGESQKLDEALGRNPNSTTPTRIEPSTYRPDCIIKTRNE